VSTLKVVLDANILIRAIATWTTDRIELYLRDA
jgi:hypothetical protein